MKPADDEEDFVFIPVAILEYGLVARDLEFHKGSLLREIYFSWRLIHPCIVTTYGAFWPTESKQGLKQNFSLSLRLTTLDMADVNPHYRTKTRCILSRWTLLKVYYIFIRTDLCTETSNPKTFCFESRIIFLFAVP